MKFKFIDRYRSDYPVVCMCRVLGVSSSGYYAWRQRGPSRRAEMDQVLQRRIQRIHQESRGIYGSPKIHERLRQEGIRCSRKRVIRLMKLANISSRRRRSYKHTTRRNVAHPVAPNRLKQQFVATKPNEIWLTDITYIRTEEGWLYLAAVLDLFSRRILGWSMAARMTETLTHKALQMAIASRQEMPDNLLHHSDRGSQYTSADYQALLVQNNMLASMSGVGNCYDNAPMESFFSLLKTELVHHERYSSRRDARTSIFDYIEVFYNRKRIHGAIGYMTPTSFEQRWWKKPALKEIDEVSPSFMVPAMT
jgi:transposase InsO family protein